jgi:hypothetical protein
MSSTLVNNCRALEHRFGLRVPDSAPGHDARVRQRETQAGPSLEVDAGGGRWLRLVSARDPDAEAGRWLDDLRLDRSAEAVILVGAGLGHVLDELERRGMQSPVAIVEPDVDLARLLLDRRDWQSWIDAGRLAILTGPDYAGLPAVARLMERLATASIHVHPVLARAWPEAVRGAAAAAGRLRFEAAANGEARRALAGRYVRQTLANAARVSREGDAGSLLGLAAGVPAIVAAAGPSLDGNVHDLHRVRDRALLIACDTAARPLLSLGVAPDLVAAVDPSPANACHLGGLLDPARTWLVAEASLHPSAFAHFDGRTFFFRVSDHAPWPWLREAGLDRARLEVWGSVVTAALDLAIRMGCSPIVLAGTDLAFTDGRPYCRGTTLEAQWAAWVAGGDTYERAFALLTDRFPSVVEPDLHGQPARTTPHLVAFRDWIVSRARELERGRVVNATTSGILHGASIVQSSAVEALAGRAPLDVERIRERLSAAHAGAQRRADAAGHRAPPPHADSAWPQAASGHSSLASGRCGRQGTERIAPAASEAADRTPDAARLFEAIHRLEHSGWRWPESWLAADPTATPDDLRAALGGPEYRAWQLGRGMRWSEAPVATDHS